MNPEDKGDVFSLELIPGICKTNIGFNIEMTIAGSYCISCLAEQSVVSDMSIISYGTLKFKICGFHIIGEIYPF